MDPPPLGSSPDQPLAANAASLLCSRAQRASSRDQRRREREAESTAAVGGWRRRRDEILMCVIIFIVSLVRPLCEPISFSTAREKHERIRIFVVQKLMCIVDILPKRQALPFPALSRPSSRASYLVPPRRYVWNGDAVACRRRLLLRVLVYCCVSSWEGGRRTGSASRRSSSWSSATSLGAPPPAPAQLGPAQCRRRRPGSGARRRHRD